MSGTCAACLRRMTSIDLEMRARATIIFAAKGVEDSDHVSKLTNIWADILQLDKALVTKMLTLLDDPLDEVAMTVGDLKKIVRQELWAAFTKSNIPEGHLVRHARHSPHVFYFARTFVERTHVRVCLTVVL